MLKPARRKTYLSHWRTNNEETYKTQRRRDGGEGTGWGMRPERERERERER